MYPVDTKMVIKDEDKFLCHVYSTNGEYFAFADLISERGRSWANGNGSTQDIAIHNAISEIYKNINS